MTESSAPTPLAIIAQLLRESCDYLRDSFTPPLTMTDFFDRNEPYLSDSSLDDDYATADLLPLLTHLAYDDDCTSDTIAADFTNALRDHTMIADLPTDLHDMILRHCYDRDDCICSLFTFQTELITRPCPHAE